MDLKEVKMNMAQGLKSFKSQLENESEIKTINDMAGSLLKVEVPGHYISNPVELL
jgi:hypothetical protein